MRTALMLAAALSLAAGAAQASSIPPEAQGGIDILTAHLRSPANTHLSSVKVGADGTVCGKASGGDSEDIEFTVSKDGAIWVNEAPTAINSAFSYDTAVTRSQDRPPYLAWRTCQKGK